MLQLSLLDYPLRLKEENQQTLVFDPIRKRWIILTGEEHVRQLLLVHLIDTLRYPPALIAVEKKIIINKKNKRFDIVVYNRSTHEPWMLIECKAPEIKLSNATLHQLLDYHNHLQCKYWMITNGHQHFCADATNVQAIKWIEELPAYEL